MNGMAILTSDDPDFVFAMQAVIRRADELRVRYANDLARAIRNEIMEALNGGKKK